MSCECNTDELPILSAIPGPRGAAGAPGTGGNAGSSGKNAYAITTASFTMPAPGSHATVFVDHTDWCAVGQSLFVESAGYFTVAFIDNSTTLTLASSTVAAQLAPESSVVPTGRRVVAGGMPAINGTALDDLNDRVYVLETAPGGNRTLYANSAPSGPGLISGDLWFDTAHDRKPYRWDGSAWVDVSDARTGGLVTDVGTLQTGVTALQTNADALNQEYVLAVVGSGASKRVAGFRVTVPGGGTAPTEFVVQADKFAILGPDGTGVDTPFYVEGGVVYLKEAVIPSLQAGKISAGDVASVNIGYAGRLFHTSDTNDPKHYFPSVDIATSSGDSHAFGSSGTGFGFAHCTPATAYGPLAHGWDGATKPTAAANASGKVRVRIDAALIGHEGNILVYFEKNNSGVFQALGARNSENGGNATISISRVLTGIAATDVVKLYVAPADGLGVVTPSITCRYEIDVTVFNW